MRRPGDTLIVSRLDRLGFRPRGLAALLDDFERRGIGLISLSEATDTGTRACRVPRRTIGVLAATDHAVTAGFSSESRPPGTERRDLTPIPVQGWRANRWPRPAGLFEGRKAA